MVGVFSHKSGLRKWISLLLATALLFTALIGFAQSAQATCGPYSVTLPAGEGYSLTDVDGALLPSGEHTVAQGGNFCFQVVLAEGYRNSDVKVTANDTVLAASSGVYMLNCIMDDVVIAISGVVADQPAGYKVTLPKNDEKYKIAVLEGYDPQAVPHGGGFAFTLTPTPKYAGVTPVVKANGQKLTGGQKNGVWLYKIADIRFDIGITVNDKHWNPCKTEYTVAFPQGKGFEVTNVTGGIDIGEGRYTVAPNGGITFKVAVKAGYDASRLAVTANGIAMKPNSNGVYGISKINTDVKVAIEVPAIADYQYVVSLPTGKGFEITSVKGGIDLGNMRFGVLNNGGITFKVDVKKGYDASKLIVKANGLVMTPNSKGVYGISAIQTDVKVTVDVPALGNYKYVVSLPCGKGYTVKNVSGGIDLGNMRFGVQHNGTLTFQIDVKKGYDPAKLVVKANGLLIAPNCNGVYTLQNIKQDTDVAVSFANAQTYTVSMPTGTGYTVVDVKGGAPIGNNQYCINAGCSMTFRVLLDNGYQEKDLVVRANGKALSSDHKGVYKLKNVQEDINVTIGFGDRQAVKFTITDEATRIRVSGYSYTSPRLCVEKIHSSSSAYKSLLKYAGGLNVLGAYDVRLKNAQLEGKVTVSFPVGKSLNGEKVRVLHLVNGKVEKRTVTVKDGRAAVALDCLSPFMVAGPAEDVINPPKTGSDNTPVVMGWLMLLCAEALYIFARKRQKTTL